MAAGPDLAVKELLDEWDEEACRLEAEAHRAEGVPGLDTIRPAVSAWRLRECMAELGALFPRARAMREED